MCYNLSNTLEIYSKTPLTSRSHQINCLECDDSCLTQLFPGWNPEWFKDIKPLSV